MEQMNMKRRNKILSMLGVHIHKNSKILDFGCGSGHTVYSLIDQGYSDIIGYDIKDYLELRNPADCKHFCIASSEAENTLPFGDNTFDLIISEQVFEHVMDQTAIFRELHRVMRPEGHALLVFPARYCFIEPHTYIPFGGVFAHRWWYKFWAVMGLRNEFQKGLSAEQVADKNAYYFVEALN